MVGTAIKTLTFPSRKIENTVSAWKGWRNCSVAPALNAQETTFTNPCTWCRGSKQSVWSLEVQCQASIRVLI